MFCVALDALQLLLRVVFAWLARLLLNGVAGVLFEAGVSFRFVVLALVSPPGCRGSSPVPPRF